MARPITIAHRGEPVGHRENTLGAFAAAIGLGVDWVEIDLRRTRDGQIVVLHDQTLERLWGLDQLHHRLRDCELAPADRKHQRHCDNKPRGLHSQLGHEPEQPEQLRALSEPWTDELRYREPHGGDDVLLRRRCV